MLRQLFPVRSLTANSKSTAALFHRYDPSICEQCYTLASILLHLCTFIIHLVIYRYGGAAAGGHRLQRLRTCTARRDRNSDKVIFDWRQSTGKTETSIGCHSAHNFICLYYFDQTIKITMINKIR